MSLRSPLTILLIDDDAEDRMLYRCFLEEDTLYTYRIFEFETTTTAMAWCQQEIADVILLDFLLPDGDGLVFLQQFREKFDNTQSAAIMLTGHGDETIAVQAMKNDAQDYLIKSKLTREMLQRAIHHAVERTHLTFELQQSRELQLIGNIALRICQSLKLDEILQTTVIEVRQFLQADRVLVYQFSPDMSGIIVAESVLPGWTVALGRYIEDTCFKEGIRCNYQQGNKRANNDIYQAGLTNCHLQLLEQFEVKANLVVPILEANQLWGLLIVHQCSASRRWKQLEIDLLEQLGVQIAIAIQQATAYEQVQTELIQRKQAEVALIDITKSKEVEEQLRQLSDRLTLAIKSGGFGIWEWDVLRDVLIWDVRMYELYGIQPSEFTVKYETWIMGVHPDDRTQAEAFRQRVQQDNIEYDCEFRVIHPDGSVRFIKAYAIMKRDSQGISQRMVGINYDITERKLAEQELIRSRDLQEAIFNESADGLFLVDPVTLLTIECNRRAVELFDAVNKSELMGIPGHMLQRQQFTPDELFAISLEMQTKGFWSREIEYVTYRGNCFWGNIAAKPITVAGRNLNLVRVTDISDVYDELRLRKQAEEQLKLTNEQLANINTELARATQLKDEFLANMSHELRTPLNAILGMAEGLEEGVFGSLNERQAKAIATIERSGRHLLELINEILDLSKIESGKLELLLSDVSVQGLCDSSLVFVRQMAFKKNICLSTNIYRNLGNIHVDDRRLRQVLINLLSNAIKFTPEGGNVKLKVWLETAETQHLCFCVTDTGIGIAPENMNKLFQPFIQLDSSLNRQYSGTGLGLSLVKRIIVLHGGTVSVSSEVGKGSCFTVSIPYHTSPQLQPTPEELKQHTPQELTVTGVQQPALAAPLILLVEDNQATIDTMSSYLESRGYHLILAKNGQQAVDFAFSTEPDLIVMDIQMPVMDGLEAMRRIRKQQLVNVPIIALTALAMSGDRETCLAAGADEYLTKPVKLKQLVTTIQKLLQK